MKNMLNRNAFVLFKLTLGAALFAFAAGLCAATTNSSLSPFKGAKGDWLRSRLLTRTNTPSARIAASQGTFVLEEIGPDQKIWARVSTNTSASGASVSGWQRRAGHRVIEVATGMNYWDGQSWVPSDPSFDVTPDAFVAQRTQHKVRLAANLNQIGAVTVTTPDGIVLHSTPVGIGLYDAASGQSAIIAAIKDCDGVLVSSNRVVYENAFNENGVQVDLIYTVEKSSFEQDVVFRSRLNVADYGFPTNSTRIQIFTEFYGAPQPDRIVRPLRTEPDQKIRLRMASPDLVDEILGWGDMAIATGRARAADVDFASSQAAAPIVKTFTNILGRTFMIESVENASIQGELTSLPDSAPKSASAQPKQIKKSVGQAAIPSPRTVEQAKAAPRETSTQLAKLDRHKRPGVMLDYYQEIGGPITGTKTFQSDTTYVLTASVTCNGLAIIEGGTVFKYPSSPTTYLKLNSGLTCKTSSYFPAIFTATDDDSVGDLAPGSTSTPFGFYANPAIWFYNNSSPSLSNVRFSFCQEAVRFEQSFLTTGATISHSQFVNCIKGIVLTGSGSGSGSGTATPLTVNNALFASIQYPLTVNTPASGSKLYHCTFDTSTRLITSTASSSFKFTNSIFAGVTTLSSGSPGMVGGYNGFYPSSNPQFGNNKFVSTASPFQTGDSGSHYLSDASDFRGKGLTSIPSTLLAALRTKTTYPPISFPTWKYVTCELTFFPEVRRYVSGAPDLGFYYDALDYTVANMILDGATITVMPGTAIGLRSDYYPDLGGASLLGFETWQGSSVVSRGIPTTPITYADMHLVQENSLGYQCFVFFAPYYLPNDQNLRPPVFDFRFSNFYLAPSTFSFWGGLEEGTGAYLSDSCAMDWSLRDCNVRGGGINLGKPFDSWTASGSVNWFNNLFDRVNINLDPDRVDQGDNTLYIDLGFQAYNNLFRGERLRLMPIPATAGSWIFWDNLFDKEEFVQDATQPLNHDYNGYWQLVSGEFRWGGTTRLSNSDGSYGPNDKVLSSAPAYQSSSFGSYYLPASGLLYNGGSRTPADAGLYHYTTRIDQTKEGDEGSGTMVNIGLHYVAAASGLPKDSDNDGIRDYAENWHGDGDYWSHTDTETDWQNPMTDGSTPDATSTAYDDIDLDGDGMVGRIEKALGKNPLVSDNPLTLAQAITGEEPDVVTFKLQMNYGSLSGIGLVQAWLDGQPGAKFQSTKEDVSDHSTLLVWQTTFDGSGQHFVQPRLYLKAADFGGTTQPITVAVGPLFPITTDHILQFDPFYTGFDTDGATVYAWLSVLDADYTIELRDPSTPSGPPIRTVSGSTTTGEILMDWDLIDDRTGSAFTGNAVRAVVTVTPPSSTPEIHEYNLYPVGRGYGEGDATVAFSWDTLSGPGQSLRRCIQKGVVDALISPDTSGPLNPNPYLYTFNDFSTPSTPGNPGFISNADEMNALILNLSSAPGQSGKYTRNFYWYGHGTEDVIGGPLPGTAVAAMDLGDRIGNMSGSDARFHPYRFVFLDCCLAGKSPLWAYAFGIPRAITFNQVSQYPARAQAFLGWKTITAAAANDQEAQDYQVTLSFFFALWQGNRFTLEECVKACSKKGSPGPPYDEFHVMNIKFPLGALKTVPLFGSGLVITEFPASKVIYGYPRISRLGVQ